MKKISRLLQLRDKHGEVIGTHSVEFPTVSRGDRFTLGGQRYLAKASEAPTPQGNVVIVESCDESNPAEKVDPVLSALLAPQGETPTRERAEDALTALLSAPEIPGVTAPAELSEAALIRQIAQKD